MSAHQVEIAGSFLGTRVQCTCGWLFVTPDPKKARMAAGEHLERHAPTGPVAGPQQPVQPPAPGREPYVREAAIAAVEVEHLSRYGHVHTDDVAADVDAVLAITASHEAGAALAARHAGRASALRWVLDAVDGEHATGERAAVLAEVRELVKWRLQDVAP